MNLNIYEIRINDNFIKNKAYIDSFLFDCECALFLVDITNPESFELIKKLLTNIEIEKYPYLKIILVKNKLDQESNRKISNFDINEFLDNNKLIDSLEISVKDGNNFPELIKKLNTIINESINEIPINIVSESQNKIKDLLNVVGALSLNLIGDTGVGKKSFLNCYFKRESNFLATIGIDKEVKNIKIDNQKYKLTLWNTDVSSRIRTLSKKLYTNNDGILFFFDITNELTFELVLNWIKDIKNGLNNKNDAKLIYLIGNKIDVPERAIKKEKIEEIAKSLGIKYFEISCKINMNIQEVMARIILELHMKVNNIKDAKDCFKFKKEIKGEKENKKKGYKIH